MSRFLTNFVCVKIYRYGETPELIENLVYKMNENRIFIVPKGFKTDFASIPRIFWAIIAPLGKHTLPAVLHDFLYTEGYKMGISRKEADKIFYNAMIDSFVNRFTANIMWACVRLFAKNHYKDKE